MNVIKLYKLAHKLYIMRIPILPKLIYYIQFLLFNSIVPFTANIGKGTTCTYGGVGVVIHARASIGADCIIGQGVTIGGRSKLVEVPKIGDRVYIAAGSRILGDVTIGNDVIIGANAVVVKNVPDGCVVAGVPAKIIKTGKRLEDYVDLEHYK